MRVLIDALPLRHGGGVTYLQAQLAALADVAPEVQMRSLVSPWTSLTQLPGDTTTIRVASVPQRFGYEIACLPFHRADILYCPANFGPVFGTHTPTVVTIQNANYYRAGLALKVTAPSRPRWKLWANYAAMRHAQAVVAISHSIAEDAASTLPGIVEKLHVIPSGAPTWTVPSEMIADLPAQYLLTIASEGPHKRLEDVVSGWALARRSADIPQLVVVGAVAGAQYARCRDLAAQYATELHFTGRIGSRAQLRWAYENASALVSMSLLEAFPLTPAEAASVGCPLVLSDIPPHREVTQGRAIFVPPGDVPALAELLVAQGAMLRPRSQTWKWPISWDDNARRLKKVFDDIRK